MSKIKEIWCMHHSHLDVGYTHPQPMLINLQQDYIEQAIELCEKTREWPQESQFKWTCEVTYPVLKWMERAEPEKVQQFVKLVSEQRISIAALPMHTTPCSTEVQMLSMMKNLNDLRKRTSSRIETAINHDINGQPWPMSQVLLDSGIDFYLTGINVHFGGIPYQRPMAFRWKSPDGRELLSFVGEHYSLFSQFFQTCEGDTNKMHQGVLTYVARLEEQGYDLDFAFLTATNPPLFDNNCPDAGLADLIRRYNAERHEYKIRFATPEMLRDRLLGIGIKNFPVYAGDWNDYWNFGCGSAARETGINKIALRTLESAGVLECMTEEAGERYGAVRQEAEENALLYYEHTWGASQAIADPEDYESQSQYIHKVATAYTAADLAGYLVSNRMEALADNPHQADEAAGILVVNPTGVSQEIPLQIPKGWRNKERQLSAVRAKSFISYLDCSHPKPYYAHVEKEDCGAVTLPPFGSRVIPFKELPSLSHPETESEALIWKEGCLDTPFYQVSINQETGRINRIYDKNKERELLDEESGLAFFELIRETVDGRSHQQERKAIFARDVDLCNASISLWNTDWKAKRIGADRIREWDLKIEDRRVIISWKPEFPGIGLVEQEAIFYSNTNYIDLKIKLEKLPVHQPEGLYLAFPLKLSQGWQCSYNTAGQFVKLDEEQLGEVCRDWVTVDNGLAVYDDDVCFGLACPQAPLVQVGGFHFGRHQKMIERVENPQLLAWPLNNYWDTNFVSGQSGRMEFSYRFFSRNQFSPTAMHSEFVRAEQRGLIGLAVQAESAQKAAVQVDKEGFITAIYPAQSTQDGIILVVRNHENKSQEISFQIPGWDRLLVYEVDAQEVVKREIPCTRSRAELYLDINERKLIRVCKA